MKKVLFGLLLLSKLCFADDQSLSTVNSMDRLEQLKQTPGHGSYGHLNNIESASTTSIKTSKYNEFEDELYKYAYGQRGDWESIKCNKDRFNGTKSCYSENDGLVVYIINGKPSVIIYGGAHGHYPRSQSAIRIDENKTFYGVEGSFSNDQLIINQMIKGKTIYTRYMDWPYNVYRDNEISLQGFNEAYKKLKIEYAKIK